MELTQCSETSAIKHHTPGNNPKDYTQHFEHGESLKSRIINLSFLSDFKENCNFWTVVSKNTQISDFTKIRLVGAELFNADRRTDRQTDMTMIIVVSRNSANAPNNALSSYSDSVFPVIVTIKNGDSFPA
jgi:hypothetical protein